MKTFHIEIVKPSHYDKDGYVIQWWKAWIPSNSMASLYAIAQDCGDRNVLGDDVAIEVDAYDEMNVTIPIERIARRIQEPGHSGLVCLVGVQSNQFPRAMAIARQFRARGVAVAMGGFHVSGCLAMLKEPTSELKEAIDLGIILYAGEAEEHFAAFLRDVHGDAAKPIYNTMDDLPNLQGQTIPYLPRRLVSRYDGVLSSFDAGRGCPFRAPSAPSSTCRAASRATAAPTTSSASCGRTRPRRSRASSSPTTISPATRTGRRSSTD